MLGKGVYGFHEAAFLTGLKEERVREWFRKRPSGARRRPIFQSDYEPVDGDRAISFLDLIDVFVAGQLREHGVSLQTLRRVYACLAEELQTPHPFCRNELLSDGKVVFMRGMDEKGQEELKEVLSRQKVFPEIILPFLNRIDYGAASRLAERWHIARLVVVDPRICFGKPVVEPVSIPTAILAAAYHANDEDVELVAGWYNVHADHVRAAVAFESKLVATTFAG
jgi:uncharacterized protein (DUF433 family)